MTRMDAATGQNKRDCGPLLHFIVYGTSLSPFYRLMLYIVVGILLMISLWLPAGIILMFSPVTYTSTWSLVLPGTGVGHVVSLDSVGQTTLSSNSAYSSRSVDPRVNYKALVKSETVRLSAADSLGMTLNEFGSPKVKLQDQTAMMDFRQTASSSEKAYSKSTALHSALLAELERLRTDEIAMREAGVHKMLKGYGEKLRDAQSRILLYQSSSHVVSMEQFTEMTVGLERMHARIRDLRIERAGVLGRLNALKNSLQLEPADAALLLKLYRDVLLRKLAERWSDSFTLLTENKARWGKKHQKVVSAREQEKSLAGELFSRARLLAPELKLYNWERLLPAYSETSLIMQLVELSVEHSGLVQQIESLKKSIKDQKTLLTKSATDASNLEDLERKHQVATAVFTTALARVDLGKSERYSSYPIVQLLARPTMPQSADTMARDLALVGVVVGSILIVLGLILLWIRKPSLQKLLKNV